VISAGVGKNTETSIVVSEAIPAQMVGYNFTLYDDDDFNDDDGSNLDGDTGEDIPPDRSQAHGPCGWGRSY
jgi:hypothetical protein